MGLEFYCLYFFAFTALLFYKWLVAWWYALSVDRAVIGLNVPWRHNLNLNIGFLP